MSNSKRALVLILLLAGCAGPPPSKEVAVGGIGTAAAAAVTTATLPSISFGDDLFYAPARNNIGIAVFGVERFVWGCDMDMGTIALSPICTGCGQWIPEEAEDRVTLRNKLIELDPHADCLSGR